MIPQKKPSQAASQVTFFAIDLRLQIQVDACNDNVGDDVECTNSHEHIGVAEWDLLGYLHHPKDDDQVGAGGGH